jgi:hypothetical protein
VPVLRNHWLQNSFDGVLTTRQAKTLAVTVPAGGTLKRIQLVNAAFYARADQTTWNTQPNPSFGLSVTINNAVYPNRIIYRKQARIPMTVFTHYNVNALTTHYSQLVHAGDAEMGFGQQCSYNGPGQPALTVSFALGLADFEGLAADLTYRCQWIVQALYYA